MYVFTHGYNPFGVYKPTDYKNNGEVLAAVNARLRVTTTAREMAPLMDFVFDCTTAQNVRRQDRMYKHWGEHLKTLEQWIDSDECGGIINDLNGALNRRTLAGDRSPVSIMLMCRSGKHRSVAMAKCMKWCLSRCVEWKWGGVVHLAKNTWPKNFCTSCTECGSQAEERRQPLKEKVLDMWYEAAGE